MRLKHSRFIGETNEARKIKKRKQEEKKREEKTLVTEENLGEQVAKVAEQVKWRGSNRWGNVGCQGA